MRFGYQIEAHIAHPTEAMCDYYRNAIKQKQAFLTTKGWLIVPLKRLHGQNKTDESSFDPFQEIEDMVDAAGQHSSAIALPPAEFDIPRVLRERMPGLRLRLSAYEWGAALLGYASVVASFRGAPERSVFVGAANIEPHVCAKFSQAALSRVIFFNDLRDRSFLQLDQTSVGLNQDATKAVVQSTILLSRFEVSDNFERIPQLPAHAEPWKVALYGLYARLACDGDASGCRVAHFAKPSSTHVG